MSESSNIKLYTKDECDALGGNWHANGECLKKNGGSFSWDNRTKTEKPKGYVVRIELPDAKIEYRTVSAVTVLDQAENVLFKLRSESQPGS